MRRFAQGCLFVVPLTVLVMAAGCQNPQKQIDSLTEEVQRLQGDLASAEQERQRALDTLQQYESSNQGLQSQLVQMQSQMGELEQRLANAHAEAAKANPATRNGWVQAPGVAMISLSSDLLFSSGKATLSAAGQRKIAEVAREIRKEYSRRDVYVIGHTDTDPIRKTKDKWQDNWDLSVARALTVTRVLQSAGVSGKQIMAAGRGEYQPHSSSKAKNRRVEIYAVEKAGPQTANR